MARVPRGTGTFRPDEAEGIPTFHLYRGGAIDPTHSKVRIPSEQRLHQGPIRFTGRMGLSLSGVQIANRDGAACGEPRRYDCGMSDAPHAPALGGRERRALRRLAHELRPVVQVGGAGLSDAVVSAV